MKFGGKVLFFSTRLSSSFKTKMVFFFFSSLCVYLQLWKKSSLSNALYFLLILLLATKFLLVIFNFLMSFIHFCLILIWYLLNFIFAVPYLANHIAPSWSAWWKSYRGHSTLWSCNRVDFVFFFLLFFAFSFIFLFFGLRLRIFFLFFFFYVFV